jgi:hypothetical protein
MTSSVLTGRLLPLLIGLLALADGILHLSLDFVLFRGNLFGQLGPPPGAPPPGANPPPALPLPLNQLFVLNFVVFVLLALAAWFGGRLLGDRRWLVDVAILIVVAITLAGWFQLRRPNPMGLGTLARGIEVVLVVAVVLHVWSLVSRRRTLEPSSSGAGA